MFAIIKNFKLFWYFTLDFGANFPSLGVISKVEASISKSTKLSFGLYMSKDAVVVC